MTILGWLLKELMQNVGSTNPRSQSLTLCRIVGMGFALLIMFLGVLFAFGSVYQWLARFWEPWISAAMLSGSALTLGVTLLMLFRRKPPAPSTALSLPAPITAVARTLSAQAPQLAEVVRKSGWEVLALIALVGFVYAQRGSDKREPQQK